MHSEFKKKLMILGCSTIFLLLHRIFVPQIHLQYRIKVGAVLKLINLVNSASYHRYKPNTSSRPFAELLNSSFTAHYIHVHTDVIGESLVQKGTINPFYDALKTDSAPI